jgi:hydrogenase expression/formation protein HypC
MCLGVPAQVIAVRAGDLVKVRMAGATRLVNGGLLDAPPRPGEWLLVHLGFALSAMTEEEATEAMASLHSMAGERLGGDPGALPW